MRVADYYAERLAGDRLRQCYEVAPPRVRRSLEAEIEFTMSLTSTDASVLELGCGYGRVLARLARRSRDLVGIDTSMSSLRVARELRHQFPHCRVVQMNACLLGFADRSFDAALCIQNGLSAFKVDQQEVVREACRVVRSGGIAVFSSYSERFWSERLEWFRIQAEYGLIGEIDEDATGDGRIVCKDGFVATTVSAPDFVRLAAGVESRAELVDVDDSILFCVIHN